MTSAALSFIYGNGFDSLTRQLLHFTDLGGSRFVSHEETFPMLDNGSLPARDPFNPAASTHGGLCHGIESSQQMIMS